MICRNCLRAASKVRISSSSIPQPQRFLTTSSRLNNATPISPNVATQTAPRQGDSTSSHTPPAATSTSAAQPFSEPLTPAASGSLKGQATEVAKKKVTPLVKSSIPAGMPLKGLNFEKNKQDPVALADDEYPAWLWTILQRQEKTAEGAGQGDLFCTSHYTPTLPFFSQDQNRSHSV
jgi:large subunit ribosomal protein L54